MATHTPSEVPVLIARAESMAVKRGWHAVGLVTYEAGAAWGLPVATPDSAFPLSWFALYEPKAVTEIAEAPTPEPYSVSDPAPSLDRGTFGDAFRKLRRHLADGDTYQANLTFRLEGTFSGSTGGLFADLVYAQQGGYPVYVDLGRFAVCSASPELFFTRTGDSILVRPMKGTTKRGRTTAEDRRQREALVGSPKQCAENVMIVDMMRNDLGRIAEVGSVAVSGLFEAERYPNVWQMTSTVAARTRAPLADVFAALHPSASVTGAPKVRTMEILRTLEAHPRGIYTGAIGHISPDGTARFNVAIRTAVVDRETARIQFGIGSGIVWDSEPEDEYDECLLKGTVLTGRRETFELLETLRWTPGEGFWLLDRHLARLCDSASYFGWVLNRDRVTCVLEEAVAGSTSPLRVRLLVNHQGEPRIECQPLTISDATVKLRLATAPVQPSNVLLFHKTTARRLYEDARLPGCDDTVLWNPEGFVTETTIANIVAELEDGVAATPPVECGLLAGTCRAELLARGEIRERMITIDDLRRARNLWVTNAVHGRRRAVLLA